MNINTVTFAARDFWRRRGASDEHTLQRSERSEQRSLRQKELPPGGLRRIWPVASLHVGHSPTSGDTPSVRLATGQIGRNERDRIYEIDHLVFRFINTTTFAARDFRPRRGASDAHTLLRSVRSEQQRLGRKEPPPGGLRRFSVLARRDEGASPEVGL